MAQNPEIFFEHDNWGRALAWSAGFHTALTAIILLYTMVFTGGRESGLFAAESAKDSGFEVEHVGTA